MNSARVTQRIVRNLLSASLVCTAFALGTNAQEQIRTEVRTGPLTEEVNVKRGVVVYVSGNDVVIKGEDGRIRDYPNVPESARVTVNGRQLSVHEIQPGMTIERTRITTETPRVITTIKSVTGTIWQITPPKSAILTLENGHNQQFSIPPGTRFFVDGQQVDAFALRPGMKVSATAVTEFPETVVSSEVERTGYMPPPPTESIDAHVALLVILVPLAPATDTASSAPAVTAATVPTEVPSTKLPKTGSLLPLIGLLSGVFFLLALGLRVRRALSS